MPEHVLAADWRPEAGLQSAGHTGRLRPAAEAGVGQLGTINESTWNTVYTRGNRAHRLGHLRSEHGSKEP